MLLKTRVFDPPTGVPNVLECALAEKCFSVQCIQRVLTKVLDERGEGLIVKNPDARYILGGRQNTSIKIKVGPPLLPEYGGGS